MPLVLCHSPKGGVGNSFLAAQLAIGLAEAGHRVVALDATAQDSLKLYFGLRTLQPLPDFEDAAEDSPPQLGVKLRQAHRLVRRPDFAEGLASDAFGFEGDTFFVIDVASGDERTRDLLLPFAALRLCAITPTAQGMAAMVHAQPGTPVTEVEHTAFVLNRLDETRRYATHAHSFLRHLLGGKLLSAVREDESVNEAVGM
ncbi:MAG TPA: cellulose synthase operon protein YhjQ/BcsQ, partial [Novosphingobium sp.]|nr:cellulose synthase operon protein YhjQ/BcsQ [Novosphingobium sp.]